MGKNKGRTRFAMAVARTLMLAGASLLIPEAGADVCCPSGCVYSGQGMACVHTSTNASCGSGYTCNQGSGGGTPGGGGSGSPVVVYSPPAPPPPCVERETKASVAAATTSCLNALRSNAVLIGCFFEDDAGRAENLRLHMTCQNRQVRMANQCASRCAKFAAAAVSTCRPPDRDSNTIWQEAFGDIGGTAVGSASVKDCGPPLKPRRIPDVRNMGTISHP
jgi:hypothetical protein